MKRFATILLAIAAGPAAGQEKPMLITSDTAEYCDQLQLRLASAGPAGLDVQRLIAEGRQMCDHGEIRGGIVRLRRALILQMKQGRATLPDPPVRRHR